MSADARKAVKQKLADSGVKLVNFGVCSLRRISTESRKTFEFAKDMGIETLVSEPAEDAFEMLDKLCEEYGINVAIHNHPKPSHYWNPDTVLKVCKGRSKRIGACADTGHWMRSGLNPIECLKKLEGRIICFHFKDLNKAGPDAHDVPWGTGVCDVKGMLTEIHRQRIKAVFSIEYEYNWGTPCRRSPSVLRSSTRTAAELAAWDLNMPSVSGHCAEVVRQRSFAARPTAGKSAGKTAASISSSSRISFLRIRRGYAACRFSLFSCLPKLA